ncbi:MAG: antibiotic biosynthesis monooxygenase [Pleurocapsa sp. SU_196_0]|nr:antibiotic biosynthesis monooxygenase [Pleurocapsa sp. SU_196_0]
MIVVAGSVRLQPQHLRAAIQLAVWMQRETQAEPGCLEYRFAQDLEQPDLIHVFENWDSLASLEAHFRTAHMTQFNAQLPAYLLEKPVVTRYTVSDSAAL